MKNKNLLFLLIATSFFACKTTQNIAKVEPSNKEFTKEKNLETDQETEALIAPYKKEVDGKMNKVIGQNTEEIVKAQPESALGNFCADAIFKMAEDYGGEKIDFSVINYGSIRIPYLAAGDITKGRIFELMPFENRLTIMELPGDIVLKFIEHMAKDGGWPVSASLRYFILNNKPTEITIQGKPFDIKQIYTVALPDYVANGGNDCDFLINQPRTDFEHLIRSAYLEYILEYTFSEKAIHPKVDGRVSVLNQ